MTERALELNRQHRARLAPVGIGSDGRWKEPRSVTRLCTQSRPTIRSRFDRSEP